SQKVSTDLAAKVSSVDLADDTDPAKGAGQVGYRGRTQADKNAELPSNEDFGTSSGDPNSTSALNSMVATTGRKRLLAGAYNASTITPTANSHLAGDGRMQSAITRIGTGPGINVNESTGVT